MWLTVERGLAVNSLAAYRRDLRRYEQFLRSRGIDDPRAVGEATVSAYVEYLGRLPIADGDARLAPASIARGLVAVRSFHRFCASEGLLETDPSEQVGAPRVPQGIPKALDEREIDAILHSVVGDAPRAQRDRAILEVLYATGVRISELVGLDLADIDLDDGIARVLGKGDKERVVPMGRAARSELRTYCADGRLALRSPRAPRRDADAVFLNARGGRLTRQGCWQLVRRAGSASVSASASRRTCCGTRARRTCSITAPTSAWCRSCSATRASRRRRCTRRSLPSGCVPSTSRRTPVPAASARRPDRGVGTTLRPWWRRLRLRIVSS